jgi:hypothetical protein
LDSDQRLPPRPVPALSVSYLPTMSEAHALEVARQRILNLIEENPRQALAACAAEDPLHLRARAATTGDDEGHLYDPSDLMVDAYVLLLRQPAALRDVPTWLMGPFRALTEELARETPSPALAAALGRALGLDDERVESWSERFRELTLVDRRDVLALLRGGSPSFREVYPGRTFDLKRDIVEVQRTFSVYRSLLSRTLR